MKRKRIAAGFLAAAVSLTGLLTAQGTVRAARIPGEEKVLYDSSYRMTDYWAAGKAPVKAGYVFGGWYADEGQTPLTEETAGTYTGTAYAKFVPAYVLSIKAQNREGASANDGATSLRVITSADSKNYRNLGVTVLLNKTIDRSPEPATRVYTGLEAKAETGVEERSAGEIFGPAASYIGIWQIDGIEDENDNKSIYIRPYWTTLDGTRVEGAARYLRVEDGYLDYISIPINLTAEEEVAAGALELVCSDPRFEILDMENGEIFEELEANQINERTIRVVGNAPVVNQAVKADGILANIRFRLKEGMAYTGGKNDPLLFQINGEDFCNWQEQTVTVEVEDIWY